MNDERVVIYLIDKETQEVCFLKKNHGPKIIVNKLVGFGGKIEEQDRGEDLFQTILNATKRELNEELEETLNLDLDIKNLQYIYQGILYEDNIKIHILKAEITTKIPEVYVESEGQIIYKPQNFHQTNSEEFAPSDRIWLTKLFYEDNFFEYKS